MRCPSCRPHHAPSHQRPGRRVPAVPTMTAKLGVESVFMPAHHQHIGLIRIIAKFAPLDVSFSSRSLPGTLKSESWNVWNGRSDGVTLKWKSSLVSTGSRTKERAASTSSHASVAEASMEQRSARRIRSRLALKSIVWNLAEILSRLYG